jgi:UPF0755 protein
MLVKKLRAKYKLDGRGRRWPKVVLIVALCLFFLVLASIFAVRRTYLENLKPVGSDETIQLVTVESGSSVGQIADLLKSKSLVKSDWAFEWYVRSKELVDGLQAGTYALRQSQGIPEIVDILKGGKIDMDLVTIYPGRRLDQIKADLINEGGFNSEQVEDALKAKNYTEHPALVDKPVSASLEGYLYPESFQKTADTTPDVIIRQSLDQMATRLTPARRTAFAAKGLSTHQAVILASIIEQEVDNDDPADRPQVAQVFLSRLKEDIRLESDPTAKYGAVTAGQPATLAYDSPYNTYLHGGLPPGPISNVSESSLEAVAEPSATDWFYFVSGDDGTTYFSRTLEEHQILTRKYCTKLCGS